MKIEEEEFFLETHMASANVSGQLKKIKKNFLKYFRILFWKSTKENQGNMQNLLLLLFQNVRKACRYISNKKLRA